MKRFLAAGILTAALLPALPALAQDQMPNVTGPSEADLGVVNGDPYPGQYTRPARSHYAPRHATRRHDAYPVRRGHFRPRYEPDLKVTGPSPTDLEVQGY